MSKTWGELIGQAIEHPQFDPPHDETENIVLGGGRRDDDE